MMRRVGLVLAFLLGFLCAQSHAAAAVTIATTPRMVMVGNSVWVTCSVPRRTENRGLDVAVIGYQSSYRQINGSEAPVTYRLLFEHLPCAAEAAMCVLHAQGLADAVVVQTIQVVGCEPSFDEREAH